MKAKAGTSEYFIITAVVFEDHEEANACDSLIDELRSEYLPRHGEFHFNKCCAEVRRHFLASTARFQYFYFTFCFNKTKLYGEGFQFKNSFYKYAVRLLFENLKPHLKDATVVFDRCGNREFQAELRTYLARRVSSEHGAQSVIRRIKANTSSSNNLLQLADMVCGAVARFLRKDKADRTVYRKLVSHRELSFRIWPR
jgi:hypothetical protein